LVDLLAPPFRMMYEENQSGEDVDPLPGYVHPRESVATNPNLAERYPLNIISPKSHGFLNSCYANETHKIKGQGEQFVLISPKDAKSRSIREGDPVRVFNDRQDFEGVARVTDDVGEGVIVATLGYWRSLNRSDGSVNCSRPMLSAGLGGRPLSRTISFRSFASTDATRLCGTPCAIRRWRSRSRLSFPAGR
jgi:anaerobic selenocysteine-containing dehydrogenase